MYDHPSVNSVHYTAVKSLELEALPGWAVSYDDASGEEPIRRRGAQPAPDRDVQLQIARHATTDAGIEGPVGSRAPFSRAVGVNLPESIHAPPNIATQSETNTPLPHVTQLVALRRNDRLACRLESVREGPLPRQLDRWIDVTARRAV